ncbi:MAG: hypothetical protein DI556_00315 [Rhodovulum sulfidophilum]|uniref:Uncharacterized protein n=1 Tax=Rhodovulum sulfidophilum TaxID=35806 RepID=A0A2W5NF59_RHOSU|nr:MAG: hypothetical protein DI556_00315 [Rhodovulum sulfidophilum]
MRRGFEDRGPRGAGLGPDRRGGEMAARGPIGAKPGIAPAKDLGARSGSGRRPGGVSRPRGAARKDEPGGRR